MKRRLFQKALAGMLILTFHAPFARSGHPVLLQPVKIKVIDRVELPGRLRYGKGTSFEVEFRETWEIEPARARIAKQVDGFTVEEQVVGFPPSVDKGLIVNNFTYEFMLAEPESGVRNRLHPPLLELVRRHAPSAEPFDLESQLLSVEFTENWYLEDSGELRKEVTAVTPVIWQRRMTADGVPVDEPGTGRPVFFKTRLGDIPVRGW